MTLGQCFEFLEILEFTQSGSRCIRRKYLWLVHISRIIQSLLNRVERACIDWGTCTPQKLPCLQRRWLMVLDWFLCLPYFAIIQPTEAVSGLYFQGQELVLSRYPKDYSVEGLKDPCRRFSCSQSCAVVPELKVPQTWDAGPYCFGLQCSDSNLSQHGASMADDDCSRLGGNSPGWYGWRVAGRSWQMTVDPGDWHISPHEAVRFPYCSVATMELNWRLCLLGDTSWYYCDGCD